MIRNAFINKSHRKLAGYSVAELPAALFMFFLVLALPLIDLAVMTLKATTVWTAAKDAARAAGRANTFQQDSAQGKLSAVNIARATVLRNIQTGAAGVSVSNSDIQVRIIGIPLRSGLPAIRQSEPLTEVAVTDYLYQIEVAVTGRVSPWIPVSEQFFGQVPGLTVPMVVNASFNQFAEHAEGLSQ